MISPASVQAGWADLRWGRPAGRPWRCDGPRPDLHTIEEHPGGSDHALARRRATCTGTSSCVRGSSGPPEDAMPSTESASSAGSAPPRSPRDVHRVVAANPAAILQRECRHTGDPVPEQRHSRPGDADLEQPRAGGPARSPEHPGDAGAAVELTVAMGGEGLPTSGPMTAGCPPHLRGRAGTSNSVWVRVSSDGMADGSSCTCGPSGPVPLRSRHAAAPRPRRPR